MKQSSVNQIAFYFEEAFQKLGVRISVLEIERVSRLVFACMSGSKRVFHNVEHVSNVASDLRHPTQTLAALFHDVVYYQADGGLPPVLADLLDPFLERKGETLYLSTNSNEKDVSVGLCMHIFGFQKGQKLSIYQGLNEFLSSVAAVHYLRKHLDPVDLLSVIVCIEATVPFRGKDSLGKSHYDHLEEIIDRAAREYQIALSERLIEEIIKRAVVLANKDVENFSDQDAGRFLDNTWRLLPESNQALFQPNVYTLTSYRQALLKTQRFLDNLNPDSVFQQYKQEPPEEEYHHLVAQTHTNLAIGREYLRVKIVAAALLEALAYQTGGDAPVSMFIGDIRRIGEYQEIQRAEDYLPAIRVSEELPYKEQVLKLLEYGRATQLSFDMQNAPISYFIYTHSGSETIQAYLTQAEQMFSGQLTPKEFLKKIDPSLLHSIAQACARIAITRREALQDFISQELSL